MPFVYTFPIFTESDDPTLAVYYATQLGQLLPPGELWKLTSDAVTSATLEAVSQELARTHDRGDVLIDETDPRTAVETLDQWEQMLGLPDSAITEIPDTVDERQLAITQKYRAQGGQDAPYFIALAAACGYTATVIDGYAGSIAYCGRARCPDPLDGLGWAYVWTLNVTAVASTALSHAELEAIIERVSPAHTTVVFVYP